MYQKWKTKRALKFYRPIIGDDTDGKTVGPVFHFRCIKDDRKGIRLEKIAATIVLKSY
jgi:hypothetical protein